MYMVDARNYYLYMMIKTFNLGVAASALLAFAGSAYASGAGPMTVSLGTAGTFTILTKTGITDVPRSSVTGDIGVSPITGAADLLKCTEVTGGVYSVDAAGPKPCSIMEPGRLTLAVLDMQTAFTDAAGRPNPNFTELGAGEIGGLTLVPGLYKWGTTVKVHSDVTISGGPNDVWIFQIAKNLIVANGMKVHLSGGAQAKNIFWQVSGLSLFGTTSHVEGIVLCKTLIAMQTGASINGRLYAQTAATLQMNVVKQPR